jgi:hypothetical protein
MSTLIVGPAMAVAFALPCFGMGLRLLRVWRRPLEVEKGRWVQLGVGVMVMEFILLHAGVFLAGAAAGAESLGLKLLLTLALSAFYGLFAFTIARAFRSRMLLESFLWVIGGRLFALLIGISADESAMILACSVLAFVIYLPLVVASVVLPFPRLGITPSLAAAWRLANASGVWVDEPHRAIGAGAIYFLVLGTATLVMLSGWTLIR